MKDDNKPLLKTASSPGKNNNNNNTEHHSSSSISSYGSSSRDEIPPNDFKSSSLRVSRSCISYYTLDALFRKFNPPLELFEADPFAIDYKRRNSLRSDETESRFFSGSLRSHAQASSKLKRTLALWELTAFGISGTVGIGIFVSLGFVARQAGPGVVLSFLFAGIAAFISGLCYSEFATRIPLSGGVYTFAYVSLGELMAWFVGWNLTLEYAIGAAGYLMDALTTIGASIPDWIHDYEVYGVISISPISGIIILICTVALTCGIRVSSNLNSVITFFNILILVFVAVVGCLHTKAQNWTPFLPFGLYKAWNGVGPLFISYLGIDSIATLSGEVRKPSRDIPIGLLGSIVIVTTIYIAVSLVITGMVMYTDISIDAPISNVFQRVGLKWASIVVAFGTLSTLGSTVFVTLVGQPRVFYQMAKDGLIFSIFGKVSDATGTPTYGTLFVGFFSAIIASIFSIEILVETISIGSLLAFTVVCGGVVVLRYRELHRSEGVSLARDLWTTGSALRMKTKFSWMPLLVSAFFASCVFLSSAMQYRYGPWYLWIFALACVIITFIPMLFFKQRNIPTLFACPFVPFVPCIGIFMNTWFIVSLPLTAIYRLGVWTGIGLVLYLAYPVTVIEMYLRSVK